MSLLDNFVNPWEAATGVLDAGVLETGVLDGNVLEQINSVLIGSTIQSVGVSDLMQIKINVPSMEEQKAKVEGIKQAFLESKKRELAYQQQLLGLTDESFREFASIKHTFRQYLNALKSK